MVVVGAEQEGVTATSGNGEVKAVVSGFQFMAIRTKWTIVVFVGTLSV